MIGPLIRCQSATLKAACDLLYDSSTSEVIPWTKCTSCDRWYHNSCIGLTDSIDVKKIIKIEKDSETDDDFLDFELEADVVINNLNIDWCLRKKALLSMEVQFWCIFQGIVRRRSYFFGRKYFAVRSTKKSSFLTL